MGSQRVCEIEKTDDEIHAYFIHADHIGSSNIITDETGSRVSLFEYKPFGAVAYAAEDNTYDTDKLFTGKTYDKSTGLHYYGARYYDSQLGRFIQPDTIVPYPYDPQAYNRYSYVRNNPLIYTDPSGNFWGIFAAIVAIFAVVSKIAAAVAIVSTVAAAVSAIADNQSLAKTFATIGMISGVVSLGSGLLAAGGSAIIKASTDTLMGIQGLAMVETASESTGFWLEPIVVDINKQIMQETVTQAVVWAGRMAAGSILTSGIGAGSAIISNMVANATPSAWGTWSNFVTADPDSVTGMTWYGVYNDFVTDNPNRAVRMLDEFTGIPSVVKAHFSVEEQPWTVKTKAWGKVATNAMSPSRALRVATKFKIGRNLSSYSKYGYKYLKSSSRYRHWSAIADRINWIENIRRTNKMLQIFGLE